jgi:cytochrome c oxidase subunit 4
MSEHKHMTLGQYFGVFAALMVLLVVTVLLAEVNLGSMNTTVAMVVATVKALLVITYFMHLRYAATLTWLFALSSGLWLILLIAGILNDYDSRDWFTGRLGDLPVSTAPVESVPAAGHEGHE